MRCKACNAIMQGVDWTINPHTNDYDDLCATCRATAFATIDLKDILNDDTPLRQGINDLEETDS